MRLIQSTLVSNALTFWVATRFIEHPWRVCEGDLAPFEPPYDPECPYSGIVPVTPIMDTQIDDIALRVLLIPLGQMILRELDGKIKQRKRENWFEIYLTTFIIMNNFELIFSDVLAYTSRHGLRVRVRSLRPIILSVSRVTFPVRGPGHTKYQTCPGPRSCANQHLNARLPPAAPRP